MTGIEKPAGPRFLQAALAPASARSLAVLRILFGSLLFVSVLRFFVHGWIGQLYIQPQTFFTFFGFSWVHPWPPMGMYLHFAVLALLALGITLGFRHRVCALLFFLGFAYIELLDVTNYLNHYYLLGLVTFLLIFLPAGNAWSLDARGREKSIPLLAVWILRAQVGIVYVYAGLGKLQSDWLFHAQPLRIWLAARSDLPFIGTWLQEPALAFAMSWSGALYDLSIPFWLLWARSRPLAYAAVLFFHLATALLFPMIGMFPWFMIALSTIFFPPDWPDRFAGKPAAPPLPAAPFRLPTPALGALVLFFAWQLLWPSRHFAYPGNPLWTEEAFRFSWNVMLMEKAGQVEFTVQRPGSPDKIPVAPSWLTPLQLRMMSTQPDLILQTAHRIAEREEASCGEKVAVFANAMVSLNGRPPAPLIDPGTNLAAIQDSFLPKTWILPLP